MTSSRSIFPGSSSARCRSSRKSAAARTMRCSPTPSEPDPLDDDGVGVDLYLDQLVVFTPGEQEPMLAETLDTQVVGHHRSKRSRWSKRRLPADLTKNLTTGSRRERNAGGASLLRLVGASQP